MKPAVTVVIPSFNQGEFIAEAIASVLKQNVACELFVLDGGSSDQTVDIIRSFAGKITKWRSRPDEGQAAAINEGIGWGTAPFVCWLNSDDYFLEGSLLMLLAQIEATQAPMVYGKALNYYEDVDRYSEARTVPFTRARLASRCIICQPATLIRRKDWDAIGGLSTDYHLAFDYDLWIRLATERGAPVYFDRTVAVNRVHRATKTNRFRKLHYIEAMRAVRKGFGGTIPRSWYVRYAYSVYLKGLLLGSPAILDLFIDRLYNRR
jgi:glycosyltransferase involved in cell wall biosynthesis